VVAVLAVVAVDDVGDDGAAGAVSVARVAVSESLQPATTSSTQTRVVHCRHVGSRVTTVNSTVVERSKGSAQHFFGRLRTLLRAQSSATRASSLA
jgi:hypothetical protein